MNHQQLNRMARRIGAQPYPVRTNRTAFTLIELLVVIALIMILAGLAAAFLPAIGESARAATAASDLQQLVLTAKQKALRDQIPVGIRLLPFRDPLTGAVDPSQVRQCQFIEQPDDYPGSTGSTVAVNGNIVTVTANVGSQVANGDYLEVLGSGLMHQIVSVKPNATSTLTIRTPVP